jgi:hypothetical protein
MVRKIKSRHLASASRNSSSDMDPSNHFLKLTPCPWEIRAPQSGQAISHNERDELEYGRVNLFVAAHRLSPWPRVAATLGATSRSPCVSTVSELSPAIRAMMVDQQSGERNVRFGVDLRSLCQRRMTAMCAFLPYGERSARSAKGG